MATRNQGGAIGLSNIGQEGIEPRILNGATLAEAPDIPSSVVAGQSFTVSGVLGLDCPTCIQSLPVRAVMEVTGGANRTSEVYRLNGRGQTAGFSVDVAAPATPGETITIRVLAQRNDPQIVTGGWTTDNTAGPFDINAVTEGQKAQETVIDLAPWIVGGGAVGAGVASYTDRSPVMGGVVGAGAGFGAHTISQEGGIGGVVNFPEINPIQAITLAALLGGGALFLGEVTDLPLPGVGDVRDRMPTGGGGGGGARSGTSRRPYRR